jgi:syntaxin 7
MSFDRLNSLEAQPTTMRRDEDPQYRDDPGFDHLAESLSDQLFTLTSNISRLSNQIALLGTKRDTERVRERVHNLLEETRAGFKDVGEGIKKVQTWEDVNVWLNSFPYLLERMTLTLTVPALPEVDTTEAIV